MDPTSTPALAPLFTKPKGIGPGRASVHQRYPSHHLASFALLWGQLHLPSVYVFGHILKGFCYVLACFCACLEERKIVAIREFLAVLIWDLSKLFQIYFVCKDYYSYGFGVYVLAYLL